MDLFKILFIASSESNMNIRNVYLTSENGSDEKITYSKYSVEICVVTVKLLFSYSF